MKPKPKTFTTYLGDRRAVLTITEEERAIRLRLALSKIGPGIDEAAFKKWWRKLTAPYDSDPRPFLLTSPNSEEQALVFDGAALVQPGSGADHPSDRAEPQAERKPGAPGIKPPDGMTPIAVRQEDGRQVYMLARLRHRGDRVAVLDAHGVTLNTFDRSRVTVLDFEEWGERCIADCRRFATLRN